MSQNCPSCSINVVPACVGKIAGTNFSPACRARLIRSWIHLKCDGVTAPTGHARQSGHYPGCDLPGPPLFAKIADALGLWARTVEDPAELAATLREALAEVRGGRSALVDVCISSSRPAPGLPG